MGSLVDDVRGLQHGLGGHASPEDAQTPELAVVDDRRSGSGQRCGATGGRARRPSTQNDDVVIH